MASLTLAVGQKSCLLINDSFGRSMEVLEIRLEQLRYSCKAVTQYFSREYEMYVDAVRRCPGAGSCDSGYDCYKV